MKNRYYLFLVILPSLLHAHIDTKLDAIEVFDHSETQSLVDFIPSVTKLRGLELQKRRQTSIGDTLSQEAGVNSTTFGPSASRPVIRGMDGDRIRVLQNSLGTLDASTQSLDHAIPVDALTVEQIEVVRGPMSLLYGSSAVGGVVNLVTNRIHTNYEEGFFSQAMVQGETASSGVSSALHLNYGKDQWMYHADGSTRNLGDQKIPDYVKGGESEKKGKLPNSANQQDNVAVGVSRIFSRGHFGLSFNHFNTTYGTVADEEVTIEMNQNRYEFHSEYRPESNNFRKVKFKTAQSDYFHKELEGAQTGTIFKNKGNESRLEAVTKSGNLEGVMGLQTQIFKFSAVGDEAFLPPSANTKLAAFSFHEYTFSAENSTSFGARAEYSDIRKESTEEFGSHDSRNFTALNASVGHQYKFDKENSLSLSYSYTERAPNFQELYAGGEHVATGIFERGDSSFRKERSNGLELNYKKITEKHQLNASLYTQLFHNYISLNPTGQVDGPSGLSIYEFEQVDALFYGFDVDYRSVMGQYRNAVITGFTKLDWVQARDISNEENLPRISPARVTLGMELSRDQWNSDIEVQYVAHQSKTADFESHTDDYALTNAGFAYNIVNEKWALNLFTRVRNIFDVESRNHVSTLKEIAPLPGRNFIVGAQIQL